MEKEILAKTETRMQKGMEHTQHELATLRTGRANASLLDGVKVDYYGTPTPLNQVAAISTPEPKLLVVQPWDKTVIDEVVKAIQRADLGLNPASDGNLVRIPVPALNEERRKELTKVAARLCEEGKVALRNIRRDANDELKKLEKAGEIPEDGSRRTQGDVQKLIDKYVKLLDEALESKQKEIMEV
jgi:ribosome recycling factor